MKSERGFTMLEMLFACAIMTIIMAGVFQTVLAVMNNDRHSSAEAELYSAANRVVERVQRGGDGLAGLMKAREASVAVGVGGGSITFSVDKNDPYTSDTADDTTMSAYLDNADGLLATADDNFLMLDPDTSVAGDEITLCEGVSALNFDQDDQLVTMSVEIERTVRGLPIKVSAQQDVCLRN